MRAVVRAEKTDRWWASEHIWALVVAIILPALQLYVLTRSVTFPDVHSAAMELVLIRLPRPAVPKSSPAMVKPTTQAAPPLAPTINGRNTPHDEDVLQVQDTQTPVDVQGPPAPALGNQEDDTWDRPARVGGDLTFRPDPLGPRPNPIAPTRPERFRMRKQITPHEIVRAISKVLFWPPGYTDNPCGEIRRSVERLSGYNDDTSRWQLIEAVKVEQKYCQ